MEQFANQVLYIKKLVFCASCTDSEMAADSDEDNVAGMLIGSAMDLLHHHLHYGKLHWHEYN